MEITQTVLDQFEIVRESGRTNMMDRNAVQVAAFDLDCFELVAWIGDPQDRSDRRRYPLLLTAFSASKEGGEA